MANSHPLIRRSRYFDYFPQYPSWFNSREHVTARQSFLKKRKKQYHYETLAHCPLCGGSEERLVAVQERHGVPTSVVICMKCSLLYTNPRLDSESIYDHYRTDSQHLKRGSSPDVQDHLFELQYEKGRSIYGFLQQAEVKSRLKGRPIKQVAEVGCGQGGTIQYFKEQGCSVAGYELNPEGVDYGKQKGLPMQAVSFSERTPRDHFDLVIYEQALEHVMDLHKELQMLSDAQEIGDLLYIGVPGLLHYPEGYNNNFLAYLEYQHMQHFCLATLERLMGMHGYRLVFGTELIRALFEKVPATEKIEFQVEVKKPQEILDFIVNAEKKFQASGEEESFSSHARFFIRSMLHHLGFKV